jgi:hypothetical protein
MSKYEISLVIDAFTPDTLPMARLAAYMREFAILLGSEERVHFKKIKKSSACIVAFPDEQSAPKVKSRLEEVVAKTAPKPALKARQDLDDLMADDNAIGYIKEDGTEVIRFPGRLRPAQERIGPVRRAASVEGQIYQIGGKDETVNVHLRGREGDIRAEVSIELARKLAPHLLLGRIRMFGEGDWYRVNGKWERHNFTAVSFTPLENHSITDAIREVQELFGGVSPDDFAATMAELRGE